MIAITQQQAQQRFRLLSDNLQDAIFDVRTEELVGHITEENKLPESSTPILAETVGLVLLGFLKPENFSKEIQERLSVSEDTAKKINSVLSEKLFSLYQKELKALYPTEKKNETVANPLPVKIPAPPTSEKMSGSSAFPLPSRPNPSPNIPAAFSKPQESFFKTPVSTPKSEDKTPEAAPVIIHEETKAQSLSTAPKLGFRASENKLPDAKDRPAPLQAVEFTAPTAEVERKFGIASGEKLPNNGAKPTTPVVQLGSKLNIPPPQKEKTSEPGLLGKVKNIFSGGAKLEPPTPPAPPVTPIEPITLVSRAPVPAPQLSVQKVDGVVLAPKPDLLKQPVPSISPLPSVSKPSEPLAVKPLVSLPQILPSTPPQVSEIRLVPAKPVEPPRISENPPPKIDLKKVNDIVSQKTVPPPRPEKKLGFLSRWFGQRSSSQKIVVSPVSVKPTPPQPVMEKKSMPPPPPPTPLPPTPPLPPKTPDLPKTSVVSPLSTTKISPLTSFPGTPGGGTPLPSSPAPKPEITQEKPKMVNYSAYPQEEKPKSTS